MKKRLFDLKPETVTKLKENWVIILPLLVMAIAFVLSRNEYENIKNNAAYTSGLVTETKYQKGGLYKVHYQFQVGNETYKDSDLIDGCAELSNQVEGKRFSVVYNSLNPNQSTILITEEDFKRFGLPFPDSLIWVKQSC